jgi:aconitase B
MLKHLLNDLAIPRMVVRLKGQAPAYSVNAATLFLGLMDGGSNARILLDLAAANKIELHAQSSDWNGLLWLISTALRETGSAYSGEDYASLRNNLPVTFH